MVEEEFEFTVTGVAPVGQYANLQPTYTFKGKTMEEAEAKAMAHMEKFFDKYSEKVKIGAVKTALSPGRVKETDLFGNEIFYDAEKHEYSNAMGELYLSGSAYASDDDFDGEYYASEFVKKYGLKEEDKQNILDMWNVNGNASASFGTALHAAIELYGKYRNIADIIDIDLKTNTRKELSKGVEKNSAMSKLPYLQQVARDFFTPERLEENALYEVLVIDHANKRAGRIDRLIVNEDGSYAIRDMKTNHKIMKKERDTYTKQLSFYGDIIIANKGKLETENPITLHHWKDEKWTDIKLEKIDTL